MEKNEQEVSIQEQAGVKVPFYAGIILGALGLTAFELDEDGKDNLVELGECKGEDVEEGCFFVEFTPTVEPDTEQMDFAKTVVDSYCELVDATVTERRCRFIVKERE